MSNDRYPHDAFCECGHWNVKHRKLSDGSEMCEFCGKECTQFKPRTIAGAIVTPKAEQDLYNRIMRGEA